MHDDHTPDADPHEEVTIPAWTPEYRASLVETAKAVLTDADDGTTAAEYVRRMEYVLTSQVTCDSTDGVTGEAHRRPQIVTDQSPMDQANMLMYLMLLKTMESWTAGPATPGQIFKTANGLVTLVNVESDEMVATINQSELLDMALRTVCFVKPTKEGLRHVTMPGAVKTLVQTNFPRFSFPELKGVLRTPSWFDINGPSERFVTTLGYEPMSGQFLTREFPHMALPTNPSAAERSAARATIDRMLSDFSFVDPKADYANAFAFLLTTALRTGLPTAPIFMVTASDPGSGKGTLVKTVHRMVHGSRKLIPANEQKDASHQQKTLDMLLAKGADNPMFWLDENDKGTGALNGQLRMLLTELESQTRLIGGFSDVQIDASNKTFAVSANQIYLPYEDMRRSVVVKLFARGSDYEWSFANEDELFREAAFMGENGETQQAVATLVGGWIADGRPTPSAPMPSFNTWHDIVGGILLSAGIDGLRENLTEHSAEYEYLLVALRLWLMENIVPVDVRDDGKTVIITAEAVREALLTRPAGDLPIEHFRELSATADASPEISVKAMANRWDELANVVLTRNTRSLPRVLGQCLASMTLFETLRGKDGTTITKAKALSRGGARNVSSGRSYALTEDPNVTL